MMVTVDQQKLQELIASPAGPARPDELRREGNLFFVGGNLPAKEALETIFDSYCQSPAQFFHLSFGDRDSFQRGEELARLIKKNFNAYLAGRFDYPAPPHIIERAYAAGVDIMDISIPAHDAAPVGGSAAWEDLLQSLRFARSVYPAGAVISSIKAGKTPVTTSIAVIDQLLAEKIIPMIELAPEVNSTQLPELVELYEYLVAAWQKSRVTPVSLLPLLETVSPLVSTRKSWALKGFIDRLIDRKQLLAGDLRRVLRVRQIEESFESAGL